MIGQKFYEMDYSKEEEFVYRKWRRTVFGKYKKTRLEKENFVSKYREFTKKRKCCVNRVEKDMAIEELKDISIKMSDRDNCAFTFTTHIMLALAMLRRGEDGKYVYASLRSREADFKIIRDFESITLERMNARENALKGDPKNTLERIMTRRMAAIEKKKKDDVFRQMVRAFAVKPFLRTEDQFYNFQHVTEICSCVLDNHFLKKTKEELSKSSSIFEPPMCRSILRKYVISKQSLRALNLKDTLSTLLLPFVYILPQFKTISIALGVQFGKISEGGKLLGRYIRSDLFIEYNRLKNEFESKMNNRKPIKNFIISGGLIPYLLGQTNKFDDIDIYIKTDDCSYIHFYEFLFDLKDSTGQRIWHKNSFLCRNSIYQNNSDDIIDFVYSLNRFSKFYRLLKDFLEEDFHSPQLIVYSRKLWQVAEKINKNVIQNNRDYYNLDSLMVDAYNIMDIFDIPMTRNALVFLDGQNYCTPSSIINEYKRVKCFNRKIDLDYDAIKLNFQETTFEEHKFLNDHFGPRAKDIGFGDDIFVAGICYQSGPYKLQGCLNYRVDKYLDRCVLN